MCYWFEKAREMVTIGRINCVGLLATQAIRAGASRKMLDGRLVSAINTNLASGVDLTKAQRLKETLSIAFQGPVNVGPFEIPQVLALEMLKLPNPHRRTNSDVIRPWVNGLDITRRPRRMWIIDFDEDMPLDQAALYETPFEYD